MRLTRFLIAGALVVSAACTHNPAKVLPAGPKPAWANLQQDGRYPGVKYLTGTGMLTYSGEVAPNYVEQLDAAARRELAKVLKVSVSGQLSAYTKSVSVNGNETSSQLIEQSMNESVDLELSGIQIVDHWRDDESKTGYALAVLDRTQAGPKLKDEVKAKLKSADDFVAKGDAALASDPGAALKAYLKARAEAESALAKYLILKVVSNEQFDSAKGVEAPSYATYEQKITGVLNNISLLAVEGDGARATPGKPLARPLVVKAEYKKGSSTKPLSGLTFAFALDGGKIDSKVTTDPEGVAKASVSDPGPLAGNSTKVVATVDWEGLASSAGVDVSKGAPVWLKGVKLPEVSFKLVAKGLASTRVLVKIMENIEEGSPVSESAVESAIIADLTKAGFDVKDSKALVDAVGGAEKLATISDAELKEKARGLADVIIVGTASSKFNKKFAGAVVYHRAKGMIRAVDVNDGKVLSNVDLDVPATKYGQGPDKAGAVALKELGEKVGPQVSKGLKDGMGF
jgi:hypothetical protein